MADLPANPMSIELSVTHRMLWWQTVDDDDLPERWHVSADVWELDLCRPEHRHVGDFSLAGPLIAASLERFASTARLAVCRLSPADGHPLTVGA